MTDDIEIENFKGVFERLDTFLEGLMPVLKRRNRAITAAHKKALRFVSDEAKPGPFGNLYRWDYDKFEQHLVGPNTWWRGCLSIPIEVHFHNPEFVPLLASEGACAALREVANTLLDLVRGQTSPQEQREARDKLLSQASSYLWHRGRIARQGQHKLDRPMLRLLGLDEDVLLALGDLEAIDKDSRAKADEVAAKVESGKDRFYVKEPLAKLTKPEFGYVASHQGRNGGSWLTSKGHKWFKRKRR